MVVYEELAVVFDGVVKSFAEIPAVRELSFHVPRGSIYGLLGPNGAGKTTSIRMLMAILRPDEGAIRVLGGEPNNALKDRIGYLPEERGLYPAMKVIDNLVFFGTMHGILPQTALAGAQAWLEKFSIADTKRRRLQELSKGNQQKVQFIATVLHEPDLVVLDEPFSGLDPLNQDLMRETIQNLASLGVTVILSTHRMNEVERICSHLTLLDDGQALVQGKLEEVKGRYGSDTVRIEVAGDPEPIEAHRCVSEVTRLGSTLEIRLVEGVDPSEFLGWIADRVSIKRFEICEPSLHNIFVRLVGGASRPPLESPSAPAPPGNRAPKEAAR